MRQAGETGQGRAGGVGGTGKEPDLAAGLFLSLLSPSFSHSLLSSPLPTTTFHHPLYLQPPGENIPTFYYLNSLALCMPFGHFCGWTVAEQRREIKTMEATVEQATVGDHAQAFLAQAHFGRAIWSGRKPN